MVLGRLIEGLMRPRSGTFTRSDHSLTSGHLLGLTSDLRMLTIQIDHILR